MGREIGKILEILSFYKALGFKELPESLIANLLNPEETSKEENPKSLLMQALWRDIESCRDCRLSQLRRGQVNGEGNLWAKIIYICEFSSDREAETDSSQQEMKLLNSLIEKMGLRRQQVYVTSPLKCSTPSSIKPTEHEIMSCAQKLSREIDIVSPKVIMTFGEVATFALLGKSVKLRELDISKIRGKEFYYKDIPVVPTFGLSHLLKNRKDKWLTWEDAQLAMRRLR